MFLKRKLFVFAGMFLLLASSFPVAAQEVATQDADINPAEVAAYEAAVFDEEGEEVEPYIITTEEEMAESEAAAELDNAVAGEIVAAALDAVGNFTGVTIARNNSCCANLWIQANDKKSLALIQSFRSGTLFRTRTNTSLSFGTNNITRMLIANNGLIGIGTHKPSSRVDIKGNIELSANKHERGKIQLWSEPTAGSRHASHAMGTQGWHNTYGPGDLYASTIGHRFYTYKNEKAAQIGFGGSGKRSGRLNSAFYGNVSIAGTVDSKDMKIRGGSDLAELFDITGSESIIPGMVVAIDAENPGALRIADQAHDKTVAGVISGAGGINSGLVLGQEGSIADGEYAVALTGRVYVYADSSNGEIEPGDLLTTSNVPGFAMKVTNHDKAQGAIIGKAMTPVDAETGLVLVLISLQ